MQTKILLIHITLSPANTKQQILYLVIPFSNKLTLTQYQYQKAIPISMSKNNINVI
jgi:hypothetical protein